MKTIKLSGSHLCEAHAAAHGGVDGHAVTALVSLHVQRVVLQRAGQENISSQHNKQTAKEHPHLHPKIFLWRISVDLADVLINAVERSQILTGSEFLVCF